MKLNREEQRIFASGAAWALGHVGRAAVRQNTMYLAVQDKIKRKEKLTEAEKKMEGADPSAMQGFLLGVEAVMNVITPEVIAGEARARYPDLPVTTEPTKRQDASYLHDPSKNQA